MFLIVVESALYLFDINSQQTEILHEFYNSGESAPILQKIPRFKSIEKNMITNDIKPINKDENIFHIIILGGSSVDLLKLNEEIMLQELRKQLPYVEFQLTFFGYAGQGTPLLASLFNYFISQTNPDLIFIYSGHNEFEQQIFIDILAKRNKVDNFLSKLRFYRLYKDIVYDIGKRYVIDTIKEKREKYLLEEDSVRYQWGRLRTQKDKEEVYNLFKDNIEYMILQSKEYHIPIILSTVSSNIYSPPYGSLYFNQEDIYPAWEGPAKLPDTATVERWSERLIDNRHKEELDMLNNALLLIESSQTEEAKEIFDKLKRTVSEEDPFMQYFLGQYYYKNKDYAKAKYHFQKAIDNDAEPHRADSMINKAIKDLTKSYNIPLIDVRKIIEDNSPHSISDYSLFNDHVHLKGKGNEILIKEFVNILKEQIMTIETTQK
jgi:tetratricopeptide (TPR) repeat protein